MKREKKEYTVQSVVKALSLMELMATSEVELGFNELSQGLSLHKSNLQRILHTMERRGYVERNMETGTYRVGLKAFELGQSYRHQLGLFQAARPVLRDLVHQCDESAYIAVLRGPNIVYLDVIQTSKPLRLASRIGSITPAYCTAAGKVQLAFLNVAQLEPVISWTAFAPLTMFTITSPDRLKEELEQVRRQGYAMDDQEYELGVRCIAVPIMNHHRHVVASISISGPLSRMGDLRLERELLPLLRESGAEISRRLGFDPSLPITGVG